VGGDDVFGESACGSVLSVGIHSRMAGHGGSIGSKVSMSTVNGGVGFGLERALGRAVFF
jgi:hypothetical protein